MPLQPLDPLGGERVEHAHGLVRGGRVEVGPVLGIFKLKDGSAVRRVDNVVVLAFAIDIPEN